MGFTRVFVGFLNIAFTQRMLHGAGQDTGLLGHDLLPVQLLQVVLWRQQHQRRVMWILLVAHFWHGCS